MFDVQAAEQELVDRGLWPNTYTEMLPHESMVTWFNKVATVTRTYLGEVNEAHSQGATELELDLMAVALVQGMTNAFGDTSLILGGIRESNGDDDDYGDFDPARAF